MKLGDWRTAFVVTGVFGLVLAAVWWSYMPAGLAPVGRAGLSGSTWRPRALSVALPSNRPSRGGGRWGCGGVVAVLAAKMLTDSVLALDPFWFAKYLQAERGFTLGDLAWTVVFGC